MEALKQALCSAPVLAVPNWQEPFILATDWSCATKGAVLSQRGPVTQDEHPIAFASRALTSSERNYAPTEGECLAARWAFDTFRYYLAGILSCALTTLLCSGWTPLVLPTASWSAFLAGHGVQLHNEVHQGPDQLC